MKNLFFILILLLSLSQNNFESAQDTADNITAGWNLGNTLESNGDWIGLYSEGKPENKT